MSNYPRNGSESSQIAELTAPANAQALNEALARNGVDAASVIAVMFVAGTTLAGGTGDQYRVLYRTSS